MRTIKQIHGDKPRHWVGDGFYVQTLINHLSPDPSFNYRHTDPFLLFDYGEPTFFAPNPHYDTQPHGVGQHPHKGFETVTIAYQGAVSHGDSAGGTGVINEGDVQWMTAGRGIIHEEFHAPEFGQKGGIFSMVQLWVNLPRAHKLTAPKYQTIKRDSIPVIDLKDDVSGDTIGTLTLIAGDYTDHDSVTTTGSADTFTPINMWDIALIAAGTVTLDIPNSHNTLLLVQEGNAYINEARVSCGKLVQFSAPTDTATDDTVATDTVPTNQAHTDTITLTYHATDNTDAPIKLLLLSGEPIGEPVAGHGPFVMTTEEELKQAFRDYKTGNFG